MQVDSDVPRRVTGSRTGARDNARRVLFADQKGRVRRRRKKRERKGGSCRGEGKERTEVVFVRVQAKARARAETASEGNLVAKLVCQEARVINHAWTRFFPQL